MNKGLYARTALACLLTLTAFLTTSCIVISHHSERVRCEKEVPLSAPLQPGSSFSASTDDGSVTVKGLDTSECKVQAKVVAYAETQEAAEELARQIDIRLEPAGNDLRVVIDRPPVIRDAHFSVSLDAEVPTQTNLALQTSDGALRITNVTGAIDAKTSDGSIKVEGLQGSVKLRTSDGGIDVSEVRVDSIELRTSDGSIRCRNIVAPKMECHTSDGAIEIEFAPDAPKAVNVDATTSDGSITFTAPPGLSAAIEADTDDGSIHTQLPIIVQGKIGKSLRGTVGAGEGKVRLRTNDGSITIR
ncbi:MAG: DUF4097 family beta strand repeat protein [Sedimentisphaerales bacterium]|nr:DUF4097 family beta strand repeat protein [Sedimentisphaerales bacterium]